MFEFDLGDMFDLGYCSCCNAILCSHTDPLHWLPHWVASSNIGVEVKLYDSKASAELPSSLEEQLAAIYQTIAGAGLMVTRVPVQQQEGGVDCGLFSITYALHLLRGDDIKQLCLDQSKMRQHLVDCFEQQQHYPFPAGETKIKKCRCKHFYIPLHRSFYA